MKQKIIIIGTGNVSSHLAKALRNGSHIVQTINSRTFEGLDKKNVDLILIAVSDDSLSEVSANLFEKIKEFNGVVAHTSGSTDISILKKYFNNYGVFYPLQSFSKNLEIPEYRNIPILIEGNSKETKSLLNKIASNSFDNVRELSSTLRKKIHLASVFVCNFVNAMYLIGNDILKKNNLPFDLIQPLMEYTLYKTKKISPEAAQTGPARRGDKNIIKFHIDQLSDEPEIKRIYSAITDYLLKKYQNE